MFSAALNYLNQNNITPILVSLIFGMLIGIEREVNGKPAGMRTCAIVCIGSCVLSLLSQLIPPSFPDRGHIAANIVQGIGFIGAGSILIQKNKVVGLTTAAVIWAVASVGIAVGFGFYKLAFVTTVVVVAVLSILGMFENKFIRKRLKRGR